MIAFALSLMLGGMFGWHGKLLTWAVGGPIVAGVTGLGVAYVGISP